LIVSLGMAGTVSASDLGQAGEAVYDDSAHIVEIKMKGGKDTTPPKPPTGLKITLKDDLATCKSDEDCPDGDVCDTDSERCLDSGTTFCTAADEGDAANLQCPGGQRITSIDFASYGMPSGSCTADYAQGSCHALDSQSTVEAACLDQSSCTISAKNNVFGDPCAGTYKRIAIAYTCSGADGGSDACPDDPQKTEPGECGCGIPEGTCDASQVETLHTVVVLIDFDDAPATRSVQWVENFLNTPGWTDGENLINVRDYWWEISRHQTIVKNHVFGYYRAPRSRSYYQGQTWQVGVELFAQALNWVKESNPDFDWDQLSLEKDGRILGLSAFVSASIPGSGACHWIGDRFTAPNGKRGGQLVGSTLSLFVVLHEYGHMLFNWPDTYNIHGGSGTGRYDLMSSNNYWIGVPNASFLMDAGWIDVIDITGSRTVMLAENGNTAVRYRNPNDPREYFVIEARNDSHVTTRRIPGADRGLYIWHIDKNVGGNYGIEISAGEHYGVSLEQADGEFDLEHGKNAADDGDAYSPGFAFTENTVPDSNWWNGAASGLGIDDIQFLNDNRISFRVTLN